MAAPFPLLLAMLSAGLVPAPSAAADQPGTFVSGKVPVDGGEIYYEAKGVGRPVVLLHAGLVDCRMWDAEFDLLAANYRVIRFDARDAGRSTGGTTDFSHYEDLRALMVALGLKKATLVGLSLGARTSIDFALAYPDMVEAIVAVAPGISGWNFSDPVMLANARAMQDAARSGDSALAVEYFLRSWTDGPRRKPEEVDAAVRARVRQMVTENFAKRSALQGRVREIGAAARLGDLKPPILAIVGDQDVSDIHEIVDSLVVRAAGTKKVIVPGAGHMVNLEKPAEFRRVLLAYLEGKTGQLAFAPATSATVIVEAAIDRGGVAAGRPAIEDMKAHPERYSFDERGLNALGYRQLARSANPEAIAVFELNAWRFPASDNVYDSLAEGCIRAGDFARAEATLQTWDAKRPKAPTAPAAIARLRTLAARRQEESRHAYKPGQPTGVQGSYLGQVPPGTTPQVFAPGTISMSMSNEYACAMSPDGTEFYFTRVSPSGPASLQVTMVTRLTGGGWTFPEPATFSAGFSAHEPHVSRDNKRVYWGWFRPIPDGEPNIQKMDYGIWASDRAPGGGWSTPAFVGQGMFVSTSNDGQVYVTDHTELPNGYLARARMEKGRFTGFERLAGGMEKLRSKTITNIAHPAIAPDGSFIVFDINGGSHLCVCFRNADGTWSDAVDLTAHGIDPMAGIAFVSPDGKYLFYGLRGDVYWVSTELIEKLRPRP